MLIGGEKWACEACVRGHRVSNCQHSDRPLQHINKKGRPVSQCQHCRSLRKSRSAHVRCDCSSEKIPNKEVCLQDTATQTRNCACRRGSRCTCALKKESLDPVLESDSDEPPPHREKRRVRSQPIGLENGLTIFTNGYHKPAHKHNNPAQKYGSPYPAPRSQSYRRLSSKNSTQTTDYPAYPIMVDSDSVLKEPSTRTQLEHCLPDSNQTSPVSSPSSSLDLLGGQHSTLSIFMPGELNWPQSLEGLPSAPDTESSIFSVGLNSTSIKWSPYDGPAFSEGFPAPSFRQTSSYPGFDHGVLEQPPLTSTPTSGELSEVDEFAQLSDRNNGASGVHNSNYGSDQETSDYSGDLDNYRISSAASLITSPLTHLPPTSNGHLDELDSFLKYSNNLNNLSHALPISTDENKKTNQGSSPFHENSFGFFTAEDESETLWINNLSSSGNMIRTASMQNSLIDDFWIQ